MDELEQTFPDEVEAYREIRANSAAVSNAILSEAHHVEWMLSIFYVSDSLHPTFCAI